MGKLIFNYGVMGCSKTANALMTRFQYEESGKKVLLLKPSIDTRDDDSNSIKIKSRIGIEAPALAVSPNCDLYSLIIEDIPDIVIIDEAQFLTAVQVEQLKNLSSNINVDIYCYGLRTDFQTNLFEGSRRLFELADEIRELTSVCQCGNKATVNARYDQSGKIIRLGSQIEIGGNEKYIPLCWKCYHKQKIKK